MSKVTTTELTARSSFQIFFKRAGFLFRSECDSRFDLPRSVLCGV